jgi:serine/threonine-protein kinase
MAISPEVIQRAKARVGTVLNGKWRLERMLGIGGMAAVYAAVHRNQNRVAIKMLHPELSLDDNVKTRFLREGYVANTVAHVGAVAVYDDDVSEDGAAFLVMELLQGETLEDRLERKGGRLPPGEVLQLADQLLDVLVAAHERGIVHRDVKPDNLFLTTSSQLKVLDFGIARLRELASSTDDGTTGAGMFMGTPAFMSPEQARGRWDEVDAQSDIWSAGATLFTLLSGRNVHEAETLTDQLVAAATANAPSLATVAPELPAPVIHLVDRSLAYDKAHRWLGARSMQAALRDALRLVAPAVDLVPPRVSLSVLEREADTIAAPADVMSAVAGHSRPGSLLGAVTSSASRALPPFRRRSRFGLAVAALLLGSVVLAGVLALRSPDVPSDPPALAPKVASDERSRVELTPAVTAMAEPEKPKTEASPELLQEAGSTAPRQPATAQSRSRRARVGVQGSSKPKAASSGSSTPSAAPRGAAAPDPFDKRY